MQCKLKAKIIEMNDNLNDTIKNFERIFISAYRKNDHITQDAAFIVLRDFYLYTPLFYEIDSILYNVDSFRDANELVEKRIKYLLKIENDFLKKAWKIYENIKNITYDKKSAFAYAYKKKKYMRDFYKMEEILKEQLNILYDSTKQALEAYLEIKKFKHTDAFKLDENLINNESRIIIEKAIRQAENAENAAYKAEENFTHNFK